MQVVLCQLDIVWEDKPANHEKVRRMLERAAVEPGALIVLPEMFSTGYSMNVADIREGEGRRSERFIADLARKHEAYVVGGVVNQHPGGMGLNEAVVCDPTGAEISRYAKQYPMTFGGESEHYVPGERVMTFRCGDWAVAPLICYDLRFPEAFRAAAKQGTDLYVVIANFPAAREAHWLALLVARAIENQAYVVGLNRVGEDPNVAYSGRSIVVDPWGEVMADLGGEERVEVVTLERDGMLEYRDTFPALKDMR